MTDDQPSIVGVAVRDLGRLRGTLEQLYATFSGVECSSRIAIQSSGRVLNQ